MNPRLRKTSPLQVNRIDCSVGCELVIEGKQMMSFFEVALICRSIPTRRRDPIRGNRRAKDDNNRPLLISILFSTPFIMQGVELNPNAEAEATSVAKPRERKGSDAPWGYLFFRIHSRRP